ncbi:MAG: NAD(P)H-hydrate dehydratase [Clostridia bacterium]|nr:NAD(P)H-hydrate dehydratase [Clostridia bacterium]
MAYSVFSYTRDALDMLPPRPEESHKGTFGKVLCVCGSVGMCGAAFFAAKAAYRMGAGLVRILTVRENLPMLQTMLPEAIVSVYDADQPDMNVIDEAEEWADVLVIGCGLGISPVSRTLLARLLRSSQTPKILDADALNLLARNPSLLKYAKGAILTPHPLEMARLTGRSLEEIQADPEIIAYEFAKKHALICVLKQHRTVVTDGGERLYRNNTGNSGMATGGSGDVLAGMLGGLLAQCRTGELPLFSVATLGVYLHGLCGDVAARELGEYSLMASDLLIALPKILR